MIDLNRFRIGRLTAPPPPRTYVLMAMAAAAVLVAAVAHQPAQAQTPACGTAVESTKTDLVADCTALLKLKVALLGDFDYTKDTDQTKRKVNKKLASWGADTAIADWKGVVVDKDRVVELDLSHKKFRSALRGTLSADIGDLTKLKKLNLSGNKLTGALPAELGELTRLRDLDLRNNAFSGAFPTFNTPNTLRRVKLNGNPDLSGCFPAEWGSSGGGKVYSSYSTKLEALNYLSACTGN